MESIKICYNFLNHSEMKRGDFMARIIIFTGKGGVGKSSVATAHALASSREGKKSLIISADMAHNLGDIFQKKIGKTITNISTNLDAIELDPDAIRKEIFPEVKNAMMDLMGKNGLGVSNINEQFSFPGLGNLFCLLKIRELYESNQYDRIFIDCAPTGETLALLKLPELLAWYMEKFFPVGKMMVRVLSPISKVKYGVTLPKRSTMNNIEKMHQSLLELQSLLKNKEICSVRLVCIPEKIVVEETKRNFMYLHLYQYQVDAVFINRVLQENIQNPFMKKWQSIQEKYIQELEEVFRNIPLTKIPWYPKEILGYEAVEKLCDTLSTSADLFSVHKQIENETYSPCEGGYRLNIVIPNAKKENIQVFLHEMDLNLKINNVNRCIPLPNSLRGSKIVKMDLEKDNLWIQFQQNTKEAKE